METEIFSQAFRSGGVTLLVLAVLSGCAGPQVRVIPAPAGLSEKNPAKLICIVENPRVVDGTNFLDAYRAALEGRGYTVNVVKKNPQASACPLTTRYAAFANGFAQLELYWEGKPVGGASHSYGASSEEAIKQMVNRLFP